MTTSTAFISPTIAEVKEWVGGSGSVANVGNILTSGFATITLPDGTGYTPTSEETEAGHLLPVSVNQKGYGFASLIPSNSIVTGMRIKVRLYSENSEEEDMQNFYQLIFSRYLDAVSTANDAYLLFQPKSISAPLNVNTLRTIGATNDIWQSAYRLIVDGMYMYSLDGSSHGYEVQTSMQSPEGYDFSYNVNDLIIQPTTQGYATGFIDAAGALTDYTGLIGKTITLTIPGIGDFTLTGQAGAVTPGDAKFQAAFDNDTTGSSITTQFLAYSNVNGAVADFISITYFRDVIWQWTPNDIGSATNLYRLNTNADSSALLFPNDGYFSGGLDPDPDSSTMSNSTAATLINSVSGAPIYARPNGGAGDGLTVTNAIINFSLATNIPASFFRDVDFGVSTYFDWNTQGDVFAYPENPDNTQKLGEIQISLTYNVTSNGQMMMRVG